MYAKLHELGNQNRVAAVNEGEGINDFHTQSLELKKQELQIREKALAVKEKENAEKASELLKQAAEKKAAAICKAKLKVTAIFDDCKLLAEKVDVEFLGDYSNIEISRMMREVTKWNEDLDKIIAMTRELEEISSTNQLSEEDSRCKDVRSCVESVEKEVRETIEAVRQEDDSRELYTLDTSKNEKVTLPVFEGRDDEDYSKWKEQVIRAFVQNRVAKDDKLVKLREVLKGHAKKLVPFSMTASIDDAWITLDKAFGDPSKLMQNRKSALAKLGMLPKRNGKGGYKAIVEWYLELEAIIKSIQSMGDKDIDMQGEAFSQSSFIAIRKMFPPRENLKLSNIPGHYNSELMDAYLEKIAVFRNEAQRLQIDFDSNVGPLAPKTSNDHEKKKPSGAGYTSSLVAYKPPRRDEKCRVCNALEAQGDTRDLYDGHLHNYITGCPRYIAMSVEERNDIVYKARICRFCHDPDYVFQRNSNHNCPVRSKKKKVYLHRKQLFCPFLDLCSSQRHQQK